jgi:hypothetical protein
VRLGSACLRLLTQMLLPDWWLRRGCRTRWRRGRRLLALARACGCCCGGGVIIIVHNARWLGWLARATSTQRSCIRAGASASSRCAAGAGREVEPAAWDLVRDRVVRARCSLRCRVAAEMLPLPIDLDASLIRIACACIDDADSEALDGPRRRLCLSDSSDGCEELCSLLGPRLLPCAAASSKLQRGPSSVS